jgi:hypothetical protein
MRMFMLAIGLRLKMIDAKSGRLVGQCAKPGMYNFSSIRGVFADDAVFADNAQRFREIIQLTGEGVVSRCLFELGLLTGNQK